MKEEPVFCSVDANYVKSKVEQLSQNKLVVEYLYLKQVLENAMEAIEANKNKANESSKEAD